MGPLFRFILPLIGSSIFQMLYNTVDFLFVGNFLDRTAAAAVGASTTLITCTVGLFSGISVGTSVVAAQAIGAGKKERADKALHTSVAFGIIGGLAVMAAGILAAPHLLAVLNTPENVIPSAVSYMRIYLLSVPMLIFYNMVAGSMRALGDSRTPFRVLIICGILNVILDAAFILLIPMGVAGVACATSVSQTVSAVLVAVFSKRTALPLSFRRLAIDGGVLGRILQIGLPTGIQTIIITFSNVMVQYYINDFGEAAVAAFATYAKVENLIYMPILAFGQASTTFAGQNTGASQYRRIRRGVILTDISSAALIFAIAGVILLLKGRVFALFMKDPEVVRNAVIIASVSFPFYWIYPVLESTGGALRGMGYSLLSMAVIILNLCVIRVSLLAFFSARYHTIRALAAVYPISWAGAAVCFLILFAWVMRKKLRKC